MSASQFTPGPWMRDGISVTVERPAGEKRQCIAITHPHMDLPAVNSCERMKANARLIAAAPDLYDGCNAMLGLVQLLLGRDDLTPELREVLTTNHRIAEARTATSKARGDD